MINQVILIGRLTKDIEIKKTNSGKSVASFTIAIDNPTSGDDKTTSFINCQVWDKIAENLYKYTHKGSLIAINGRLQQRTYNRQDGSKTSIIEVIVNQCEFLDSKGAKQEPQEEPQEEKASSDLPPVNEDSLPF